MLSHTSNNNLYFWSPLKFSGSGQYGVMIFFFLSAFLLSRPFFQRNQLVYSFSEWSGYVVRRIFRIVPLYYTVLVFDFFVSKFYFASGSKYSELFDHFLFKKGYNVFWTMPVEMKFYFVLPILVLSLVISSRNKIVFWSVAAIFFASFVLNAIYANTNYFIETLFISKYIPCFISGILMSYLLATKNNSPISQKSKIIFELIAFASIILFITQIPSFWYFITARNFNFSIFPMADFFKYRHLLTAGLLSLFIYCFLHGKGYIRIFLSSSTMQMIGNYSYGMYLTHYLVIHFLVSHSSLHPFLKTAIVFIASFVIGFLAFKLIEQPFINLSKKFSSTLKGNKSQQPSTPQPHL